MCDVEVSGKEPPQNKKQVGGKISADLLRSTWCDLNTQKKNAQHQFIFCTAFNEQPTMPFDKLPYYALVELFQWLGPGDKLRCTLVCRSWNEAISTTLSLMDNIKLRVHTKNAHRGLEVLENTQRHYQQLEATLGLGDIDDRVFRFLAKVIQQQWKIKHLRLIGEIEPMQRVMPSVSFSHLTELEFIFHGFYPEIYSSTQEIVFECLERFSCIQWTGINTFDHTVLRLIVPNLKKAVFTVMDNGNRRDVDYHLLVELRDCSKLKDLELDVQGNAWERFFAISRPHLERLKIRQTTIGSGYRGWNMLFTNVQNLRCLEICGPRLYLCDVDISNLNTHLLERLYLHNVRLSSSETLQCDKLTDLLCASVHITYFIRLFAPNITRLVMLNCCYSVFTLCLGSQLQSATIRCVGHDGLKIKDMLQSLENLRELALNIDETTLNIIHELGTLPNLRSLEVTFRSHRKHSCQGLVEAICSNCPAIRELTIEDRNQGCLRMSPSSYEKLRKLRLHRLKLRGLDRE